MDELFRASLTAEGRALTLPKDDSMSTTTARRGVDGERTVVVASSIPEWETEPRLILTGVSWTTYEQLLTDFADSHRAHFAYDRGVLEIMILSVKHERLNRLIAALFEALAEENNIDFENVGSTTFSREDLARGFEPDSCFFVQHAERVRNMEEIDLTVDPPPDLIIEIDVTSPSLDKLSIYSHIGVPEVWRYSAEKLTLYRLDPGASGQAYAASERSTVLPNVTCTDLQCFIEQGTQMKRTTWLRSVREWARGQGS